MELSAQDIREQLERRGLTVSAEEAEQLVTGMNRSRRLADSLRDYVTPEVEPAISFGAEFPRS